MKKFASAGLTLFFGMGLNIGCAQDIASKSKVFPLSDEALTCRFIEGLPNLEEVGHVLPTVKLSPEESEKWAAVVEVPAYVDFLDAKSLPAPAVSDVTRGGKPYKRYEFKGLFLGVLTRTSLFGGPHWGLFYSIWVPQPTAEDRASPGVFAWHFVTPEGVEKEQAAPIQLLPTLPETRPPRRVHVRFYTCPITYIAPEKLGQVLTLLQRVGVTDVPWWESTPEALIAAGAHEKGMRIAADQSGLGSYPAMENAKTDNPDYQNRDHLGKPLMNEGGEAAYFLTDAQWILDEKGKPWAGDLEWCRNAARGLDVLSEDVEWAPLWDNGFSPAGIKAFAARFGLNADGLTPAKIWANHRTQWGDFRAEQTLGLHKLFCDAAKAGNPKVNLVGMPRDPGPTTDGGLMSDMIELGKDAAGRTTYLMFPFPTRRMQEAMDVVAPMWYDHGIQQVKEAFTWSRAIAPRIAIPLEPVFLGQGREDYYPGGDPGEVLRATYWGALLGGAKGYTAWQCEFSPLQLSWIARTNREVSRVEDILMDGQKDPAGVTIQFVPERHMLMTDGKEERKISVPDFAETVLHRCFANGNERLVGIINLNPDKEVFARIAFADLPAGEYRVTDVSEQTTFYEDAKTSTVSSARLAQGIVVGTPANYGVTIHLVGPAQDVPAAAKGVSLESRDQALAQYCKPDARGETLAERGNLSIAMALTGNQSGISMKSPSQELQILPDKGGKIVCWRLIAGNRDLIKDFADHGGAGEDLFWVPADAQNSGDEDMPYKVISSAVHGGVAYLTLQQKKRAPALNNLIVTKTFSIRADQPGIEVEVTVKNPGPVPEVNFAYWAHNMFFTSAQGAVQEVYLQAAAGPTQAPETEFVWAKPNQPFSPGNETWEKQERNGTTTGNWIAQYNPAGDDAVVCQVVTPEVAQFYSWRSDDKKSLTIEWMYPVSPLKAGQKWTTTYRFEYVAEVKAKDLKPLVAASER